MKGPKIGTYAVICPDFRKDGFMTRAAAEWWIKSIEKFGQCRQEHKIEVVGNA